jgi:phosphoglycerate dehydrogenase-like enzyme
MKPTARLVNTSRGPIVDEGPNRSPGDVLATPHIGYVTEDLYRTFYGDAAADIARWLVNNTPSSNAE